MQVRVRHFGDPFNTSTDGRPRVSLFLLNHRTQLDWFFSWGLGIPVQRMKIILKDPLSRLPGAGWAMQCGAFVFLRRQIATDQSRIIKLVSYLLNVEQNCEVSIVEFWPRSTLTRDHALRLTAFTYHSDPKTLARVRPHK